MYEYCRRGAETQGNIIIVDQLFTVYKVVPPVSNALSNLGVLAVYFYLSYSAAAISYIISS